MFVQILPLRKAEAKYGRTITKIKEYINDYKVFHTEEGVEELQLHLAINLITIKTLWADKGKGWYDMFLDLEEVWGRGNENPFIKMLYESGDESFLTDKYSYLEPNDEILLKLKSIKRKEDIIDTEILNPSKEKQISQKLILVPVEKKYLNGHGTIRIRCKDCDKSYDNIKECKHRIERKVYYARWNDYANGVDYRKQLVSKIPSDAVREFNDYYNSIINNNFSSPEKNPDNGDGNDKAKMIFLKNAIDAYLKIKLNRDEDGNTFDETIKVISKPHYKEAKLALDRIAELFKDLDINFNSFRLDQFTLIFVRDFAKNYQKKYKLSNRTMNRINGHFVNFINTINKYYHLKIDNNFLNRVLPIKNKKNPVAIRKEQFNTFITWIKKNKNNIDGFTPKVSKHDLLWLPLAFQFQYLITSRREDVMKARWSHFRTSENEKNLHFISLNLKATRQSKAGFDNPKIKQITVSRPFMRLLKECGYEKYKNSNDYIIFGELEQKELIEKGVINRLASRDHLYDTISRGWTFLFKKCFGEEATLLTNKAVRKSNITNEYLDKGEDLDIHSDKKISKEFYIDDDIVTDVKAKTNRKAYKIIS